MAKEFKKPANFARNNAGFGMLPKQQQDEPQECDSCGATYFEFVEVAEIHKHYVSIKGQRPPALGNSVTLLRCIRPGCGAVYQPTMTIGPINNRNTDYEKLQSQLEPLPQEKPDEDTPSGQ